MIFWLVATILDLFSIYFLLFCWVQCLRGRVLTPSGSIFVLWTRELTWFPCRRGHFGYTVRTGFFLMSLFLSTSCTQNCPETKRLKLEKLMYIYLKCMLFLKMSQHALIFESQFFSKVSRYILIFEAKYYSNVICDVLIFETV